MRRIVGNSLIAVGAGALFAASIAKMVNAPQMVTQLNADGFMGKIGLLAAVEIVSALAFAIPATRALGLPLVSAFLGGAVATHMQHGLNPAPPAFLLGLCWLGAWAHDPIALWSFQRSRVETSARREPIAGVARQARAT
ncbi:MAG: hypothetical protein ACM3SX_18530 [Deltaproteobacteria bacterium]